MELRVGLCCFALALAVLQVSPSMAADGEVKVEPGDKVFFPFSTLIDKGYEVRLEVNTIENKEGTVSSTTFMHEYHDFKGLRGQLHGIGVSYYYFADTDELVVVTGGTKCEVHKRDDSGFFSYPMSWGWFGSNSVIGPSAILFRDTESLPVYTQQLNIRGIICDQFTAQDKIDTGVTLTFCVSEVKWGSSNDYKRVPIQATAKGTTTPKGTAPSVPIDYTINFLNYHPDIESNNFYMIPRGIGCPGLSIVGQRSLPAFNPQFSYTLETYDVTGRGLEGVKSAAVVTKVWYDHLNKLTKITGVKTNEPFLTIQDYNTGVEYDFDQNGQCSYKALRNSYAEQTFGGLVSSFKTPEEFLSLDGDYYYVGQDLQRGVYCDIWEKVKMNAKYYDVTFYKIVYTYYIGTSSVDAISDGDTNLQIPVAIQMSMYILDDTIKPIVLEYNVFKFDQPQGRTFFDSMNIEGCFPDSAQKSFFNLYFPSNPAQIKVVKENRRVFELEATIAIQTSAKVSLLRIPQLNFFYEDDTIMVQGMLLEKPPLLAGFFTPDPKTYPPVEGDKKEKNVQQPEDCAVLCLEDLKCAGFSVCQIAGEAPKDCYLTYNDGKAEWGTSTLTSRSCQLYMKSVETLGMSEAPLEEAIELLNQDAQAGKIVVTVPVEGKDSLLIKSNKADVNAKPFSWEDSEKYEPVQTEKKLQVSSQTTRMLADGLTSPRECYERCLKEESMDCASFSYCPNQKSCLLSSVYVDSANTDEVEAATGCTVYRKQALMFFEQENKEVMVQIQGVKLLRVNTVEECAFKCKNDKEVECRGFQFCEKTLNCVFSTSHTLNMSKLASEDKEPTCNFYSMDYGVEFKDFGRDLVVDPNGVTVPAESFKDCAKGCFDLLKFPCKSINYCPASGDNQPVCVMNTMDSLDDEAVTQNSDTCQHYSRGLPSGPPRKVIRVADGIEGVSSSSFAGIIVGLLMVGVFLGIVGFLVFSYYKSKKAGGDGVSVRFTRQQ